MALAVGLTPQLLPAIISVNLSHGAEAHGPTERRGQTPGVDRKFRQHECAVSDKTGTLTEGSMRLHAALDLDGQPSERVLFHGRI